MKRLISVLVVFAMIVTILSVNVFADTAATTSSSLISDLKAEMTSPKAGNEGKPLVFTALDNGFTEDTMLHTDRTNDFFSQIPSAMKGATLIQTPQDAKAAGSDKPLLSFSVTKDATVYLLLFPKSNTDLTYYDYDWRADFKDTGMTVNIYDTAATKATVKATSKIVSKNFAAGSKVTLYGENTGNMNYNIVVKEQSLINNLKAEMTSPKAGNEGKPLVFTALDNGFTEDTMLHTDRTNDFFSQIPSAMKGATLIQTPQDAKAAGSDKPLVSFNVAKNSKVYLLLFPKSNTDLTYYDYDWRADFKDTGMKVDIYDTAATKATVKATAKIVAKSFAAGSKVTLYGENTGNMNYNIVVAYDPNFATPTPTVAPTPTPVPLDIKDLTILNGQKYIVMDQGLKDGVLMHTDRTTGWFSKVPAALVGNTFIQVPQNGKGTKADQPAVTFTMKRDATVYIFVAPMMAKDQTTGKDVATENYPAMLWYSDWTETNLMIGRYDGGTYTAEAPLYLEGFGKDFKAGETVTLNGAETGNVHYGIVIVPGTGFPTPTPEPTATPTPEPTKVPMVPVAKITKVVASNIAKGSAAANAIDSSSKTYWNSGVASKGSASLTLSLNKAQAISKISLDYGTKSATQPKSVNVMFSNDGKKWSKSVSFAGSKTTLSISKTTAKFIKLVFNVSSNKSSITVYNLKLQ